LIPTHNEGKNIRAKLENISNVTYPKEKIEIVVADDASTDNTLQEVYRFKREKPELNIKIVKQKQRVGKAKVLNSALPLCTKDIIIVSDADCIWQVDALSKAIPYLADPKVGAITGIGLIENQTSWITKNEANYLNISHLLRFAESKIYSTIRFEGGFCAYKAEAFKKFDDESGSDDSGTALSIVQNGFRALCIPEVKFTTKFPESLEGKVKVKIRRACQLVKLWLKCLRLLLRNQLILPEKIAIPNIFIFIINPLFFFALIPFTLILATVNYVLLAFLAITLTFMLAIPKLRRYFIELIMDNFILLYSLTLVVRRKKFVTWEKA
jgi:cellulose synthase/poly-beta-1,6-N-acetylglucosamine synthase-like glycosyltransferase